MTNVAGRNDTATSKLSANGASFGWSLDLKSGRLELTGNGNTLNSRIVVNTLAIGGQGSLAIKP